MQHYDIQSRAPLSAEATFLLKVYPRADWSGHPNFGEFTRYWLGSHQMFRQLTSALSKTTEQYLDKAQGAASFAAKFGRDGNNFLSHLHNHHSIEDHSFFPEIRRADNRFEAALETLEKDHTELASLLEDLARTSNRVIKLSELDPPQSRSEAGYLHEILARVDANLDRHLTDEEDLIMPILLLHRLRG